jgi:hypothetical protein
VFWSGIEIDREREHGDAGLKVQRETTRGKQRIAVSAALSSFRGRGMILVL